MKYGKPPLSFADQARLLISRGLIVKDSHTLEEYLSRVNYYRLSGYWYSFKYIDPKTGDEKLKAGTTFEMVRDRYEFDRQLRLLLMDAIDRIEVAIFRTQMVEAHTLRYGPFGYADFKHYNPKFRKEDFADLLLGISEDESRSHEEFVRRYRTKYGEEKYLPFWMAAELMSFGQLLTLYRNLDLSFKQLLSRRFNLNPPVFDSWLLTLHYIRNSCAHHARLWNRPLPLPPKLPLYRNDQRWYDPVLVNNTHLFAVLTLTIYLLDRIDPANTWKQSVKQTLKSYPGIPINPMGFPTNWQESPFWR